MEIFPKSPSVPATFMNPPSFSIQDAADLYSIERWGGGYFAINESGARCQRFKCGLGIDCKSSTFGQWNFKACDSDHEHKSNSDILHA